VKPAELAAAKDAIHAELGDSIQQLRSQWQGTMDTLPVNVATGGREALLAARKALTQGTNAEDLWVQMRPLLHKAMQVMLRHCEHTTSSAQPGASHPTRVELRRVRKTMAKHAAMRWLQLRLRTHKNQTSSACSLHDELSRPTTSNAIYRAQHSSDPEAARIIDLSKQATHEQVEQAAAAAQEAAREDMQECMQHVLQGRRERARKRFDTLFATKRKIAHKNIFNPCRAEMRQMRHPHTQALHSSAKGVNTCLAATIADLMGQAPAASASSCPPWCDPQSPDPMPPLRKAVTGNSLEHVMNHNLYREVVRSLGNGKAPGPDGIPNELLKHLPDEWHEVLHLMLVMCWIMGKTPQEWKQSLTIMLHKKGDEQDSRNYRPIGLAQTIGKLFTKLVTVTMVAIGERHEILSQAQEGGLAGRNTARQARNLINAAEDAALTGQRLYVAYFDFSTAFNSVHHTKLAEVLEQQGYPLDAVEVVRDLYTGAQTCVAGPGDELSEPIPILRGTIQGDSLSPLLFLAYMDPLLRWLHWGGRGYKHGCINMDRKLQTACAGKGFVDDTALLTNDLRDLKVQTKKLEVWANWAGLKVNHSKCAVSGINHEPSMRSKKNQMQAVKNEMTGTIKVNGTPLPFLPQDMPYKYLGWHLTLDCNWRHQLAATKEAVTQAGKQLAASMARPRQATEVLRSKIRAVVRYSFSLAPFTVAEVTEHLDGAIARVVRACLNLPKSFPKAGIQFSPGHGGAGIGSLMAEYVQANAASLTQAMNDTGPLGEVTRALAALQAKTWGGLPAHELQSKQHYATALRQAKVMLEAGLTLKAGLGVTASTLAAERHGAWEEMLEILRSCETEQMQRLSRIHWRMLAPMRQIGITSPLELLNPDRTEFLDTTALAMMHPRAGAKHKILLNRITLAVCHPLVPRRRLDTKPLSQYHRQLRDPAFPEAPRAGAYPSKRQSTLPQRLRGTTAEDAAPRQQAPQPMELSMELPSDGRTQIADQHQAAPKRKRWQQYNTCTRALTEQSGEWPPLDLSEEALPNEQAKMSLALHRLANQLTPEALHGHNEGRLSMSAQKVMDLYDEHWLPESIDHKLRQQVDEWHDGEQLQYTAIYFMMRWHPSLMVAAHYDKIQELQRPTRGSIDLFTTVEVAGEPVRVVLVHWDDSPEREEGTCEGMPGWDNMLTEFHARMERPLPARPLADAGLAQHERQGYSSDALTREQGQDRAKRDVAVARHCLLDPLTCNPDHDLQEPPNRWLIQQGQQRMGTSPTNTHLAFVYSPDGRMVGALEVEHLQHLVALHRKASSTSDTQAFATDIGVMLRTHDAHQVHSMALVTGQYTECGERRAIAELAGLLQLSASRFHNPITGSPHVQQFWTESKADECMGATVSTWGGAWTGLSWARPPDDPDLVSKAVRWAAASAAAAPASVPVATILCVPNLRMGMVNKLGVACRLGVEVQVRIQGKAVRHTLVLCDNKKGRERWGTKLGAKGDPVATPGIWPHYTPRALRALMEATKEGTGPWTAPWTGKTANPINPPEMAAAWPCIYNTTGEDSQNGHSVIYTDGSSLPDHSCGAACIIQQDISPPETLHVLPKGEGATNTAYRAELSAIHAALTRVESDKRTSSLVIFTDSASAIHSISKQMGRPESMRFHIHRAQLAAISTLMETLALRGCMVRIRKVKAHIGIRGNEMADKAAKQAASGAMPDGACIWEEPCSPEAYPHLFWPHTRSREGEGNHGGEAGRLVPVSNLTQAVARLAVVACEGKYVKRGVWAVAWLQIIHTMHVACSSMWISRVLLYKECRTGLLARWGSLYTARTAQLHKRTIYLPTGLPLTFTARDGLQWAACPLCQGPDGCSHMMGGCRAPQMKALQIARHDEAVKMICHCISAAGGEQFSGAAMLMDAGKKDELPADVMGKGEDLRTWLLACAPLAPTNQQLLYLTKPDIVMLPGVQAEAFAASLAKPDGADRLPHGQLIVLLEVGFCSDTRAEVKEQEKLAQHANLRETLQALGFAVQNHVVPLGHFGSVFKGLGSTLHAMGVQASTQNHLVNKLAANAVHYSHACLVTRRRLEAEIKAKGSHMHGDMQHAQKEPG
jgi:ribonuclease HI